ncbi:hypothetical protein BDC45DRAFT_10587 [Circinella umbellata]|nr:hypothetical protein BDC45DRAFT_10587 [Circinella umbellata]
MENTFLLLPLSLFFFWFFLSLFNYSFLEEKYKVLYIFSFPFWVYFIMLLCNECPNFKKDKERERKRVIFFHVCISPLHTFFFRAVNILLCYIKTLPLKKIDTSLSNSGGRRGGMTIAKIKTKFNSIPLVKKKKKKKKQ